MVYIPFEVEHVSSELIFSVFFLLFLGSDVSCFFHLFILITVIVSTSALSVLFPITHAQPTELKPTQLACHMVTPLIFLNRFLAVRATFSICQNPINILTLIRVLHSPLLRLLTRTGSVRLVSTLKAIPVPALT